MKHITFDEWLKRNPIDIDPEDDYPCWRCKGRGRIEVDDDTDTDCIFCLATGKQSVITAQEEYNKRLAKDIAYLATYHTQKVQA